jgi:hypothetical protein
VVGERPEGIEMREPGSALRTVIRTTGANEALKSGDVVPQGFRFDFDDAPPLFAAFRKMVRDLEYDVSEMALTTYLVAKEHGVPFTALPVFLVGGLAVQIRAELAGDEHNRRAPRQAHDLIGDHPADALTVHRRELADTPDVDET